LISDIRLVKRVSTNDGIAGDAILVDEEGNRVNGSVAVGGGSLLLTDFQVKMVIATVATTWVTGLSDDLTGILEARVGGAHMPVQNKPITTMLNNTLGSGSHRIATAVIGTGGNPSRANGRDVRSVGISKVKTHVHTTRGGVPLGAIVP